MNQANTKQEIPGRRLSRRWMVIGLLAVLASMQASVAMSVKASQKAPVAADLILHSGFVWTVDEARPQAQAIAVGGDKIIKAQQVSAGAT